MHSVSSAISIVIVTMDRPALLERCLRSILCGSSLPLEIVVSDDSRDPQPTMDVCERFPLVRYVRGPQLGVSANRQNGATACRGDFIAFLDDDIVIGDRYVDRLEECAERQDPKAIYTGTLWDGDRKIVPRNLTFWGHFLGSAVESGNALECVNICVCLFPAGLFTEIAFDPKLHCYEDADFCGRAVALGYAIVYVPDLYTIHLPLDRTVYSAHLVSERYYVGLKRWFLLRKHVPMAVAYLLLAPLHQAMHYLKARRLRRIPGAFTDMAVAIGYLRKEISGPKTSR